MRLATLARVSDAPRLPNRRWWWVAVAAFVVAYVLVLLLYRSSGQTTGFEEQVTPPEDGVKIVLSLSSMDAQTSGMDATVSIVPGSELVDATGALNRRVQVVLDPISQSFPLVFEEGFEPSPLPITIRLDGDLEGWPFDHYQALVSASATQLVGDQREPLDFTGEITGHVIHGWRVDATDDVPQPGGDTSVFALTAKRAGGTLVMGLLLVLVLIALPVLAFFVVYETMTRRRKVEATFFSWFAALLFATIPIRGFLPGAPPPGSWIDVAVVVWVLAGLVTALAIYVWCWTRWGTDPVPGRPAPDDPDPADPPPDGGGGASATSV